MKSTVLALSLIAGLLSSSAALALAADPESTDSRQVAADSYIQRQADAAYEMWKLNPHHPSLQFKRVDAQAPIYSVRVGRGYRALGWREGDTVIWFWIGDHDEYDRILR